MTLRFQLPFPPTGLRPNARTVIDARGRVRSLTPRRRAGLARQYGGDVWLELRAQYGPPPLAPVFRRARLDLEAIYPTAAHHWDDDAVIAAFKSGRDQLTRFGLIADDRPRYLTLGSVTTAIDRRQSPAKLHITLTELEPDHDLPAHD